MENNRHQEYLEFVNKIKNDVVKNGNIFDLPPKELTDKLSNFKQISEDFFRHLKNENI